MKRTTRTPKAAQVHKPVARRKLVKKVMAATEGRAQKFWNDHKNNRKQILRYMGASKMQIEELWTRDWFALSGWVRTEMKNLTKGRWEELEGIVTGRVTTEAA